MSIVYRFVVVDDDNGTFCIQLQPCTSSELPALDGGTLGLDLRPGMSRDEAEQLAQALNRAVTGVTHVQD